MGQAQWNKLDDAQTNDTWDSLDLTGFPSLEFRPLYRLIFRTATAYTNTPKAYLADIQDNRLTNILGTVISSSVVGLAEVVSDTSPQLGGDLDVNGFDITAVSGQPITIAGVGSGSIFLTPDTGYVYLDGLRWPAADGSANQVLKTDGAGNLSWTTLTTVNSGTINELAFYSASGTISSATDILYQTTDNSLSGSATAQQFKLSSYANTSASYLDLNQGDAILKATNLLLYSSSIRLSASSGSNATMTTWGSADLILNTNSGTNSGTIRIFDGANQNITITPNGTGKVDLAGAIKTNTTTGTPTDTATPISWLKVTVGASDYYLPLYQ
jgi:hypothetical protein